MNKCPYIDQCNFFNVKMANMPQIVELMQRKYCKKDFTECARYIMAERFGVDNIPDNMFPHETNRANRFVK